MELHLTAMGSHLPCHPTQVNTSHLNPSQTGGYSTYLPWRDGRLSWPRLLVTYWHGFTRPQMATYPSTNPAGSWTRNLLIRSLMP